MTEQYLPTNVNAPRGSRLITEDTQLNLDDDLVVVENTGVAAIVLVLPDATQIPAREIKFKANTLANPVTIGTVGGQTIDGAATISLTADQESVCLKSDGENWREVCGGGGGGGAPARAILPIFDIFSDAAGPGLSYKVGGGDPGESIVIQGEGLTGITVVEVDRDVNGPLGTLNTGPPPIVGALIVTDTSITVPLDCGACSPFDLWGVILKDAAGNVYAAPSPVKVFLLG